MKKVFLIQAMLFVSVLAAEKEKSLYYLETDPASYLFDGYSINLFYQPDSKASWRVGAAAFAFDFPDFIIEFDAENEGKRFQLSTLQGFDLYWDKIVSKKKSKECYAGLFGVYFNNRLSQEGIRERSGFEQLSIGGRIGLNWYPLATSKFYISPWIALTSNQKLSGHMSVNNENYHMATFSPFMTIHIGYRF